MDKAVRRKVLIWLTVAVFGIGATLGAVATWRGVGAALWGDRVAGSVSQVKCATASRGSTVCHGLFTAADGSATGSRVLVEGSRTHADPQPARMVRSVSTLGVRTVQEEDTAYVGSAAPTAVLGIVLAIVLTLFALVLVGPALAILVLRALTRARERR